MAQNDTKKQVSSHGDRSDHDDQSISGLKKKRIQQACRPCGTRRVKCDGLLPCIKCIQSGEICEYGQPKKRGPPKGSTRGGSKAARRKVEARLSASARDGTYEAAAAQPVQSTCDYAATFSSLAGPNASGAPLSRPPVISKTVWTRTVAPPLISSSTPARYPPQVSAYMMPHSSNQPHHAASVTGPASTSSLPPTSHAESYPYSAHTSPDSHHRSESHRTGGSAHDDNVGSPKSGGVNASSPGYYPPHSQPSRFDTAPASHGTIKQRIEPFYRGSSSGLGLFRPPPATADRKLPPLDFHVGRSCNRSSSSPSNYGRLSITSDTYDSAASGRSGAKRSFTRTSNPYARPSPAGSGAAFTTNVPSNYSSMAGDPSLHDPASASNDTSSRSFQSSMAATSQVRGAKVAPEPAIVDEGELCRAADARQAYAGESNRLLVEGTLLQLKRDQAVRTVSGGADSSNAAGVSGSNDFLEDINLEPLLWVEPGEGSRNGVNRSGVSLSKPEIPPLIQERLFTIFWGIVQTIWPALYKPALCLTGFDIIDPKRHPMLHNAACALAAVAWDSGEFGVLEEDVEATQSDLVERTASDLSFSHGPAQLADGTSLGRLSAADLGDIFLARAKYYLIKANNEPSLETIQSLLFMALREGGNGRASQASAYISTACRMCIDLGLHRQRDFSSVLGLHFSHAEEQARRRIFWCLYLLDKTSSASLGRPVTLRYAEIDCPLPNVDEVDEHETWAETTNNSSLIKDRARNILLKTPVAAMTHLKFGVRLGQICEQVIAIYTRVQRSGEGDDDDCGSTRNDNDETVPEWETRLVRLHAKLVAWERDLPYRLRFDVPSHRLPNTLSQHLWYQASKVMLHRPYILKQSCRPDLPPSHRICTDAVGSICDILTAYDHNFGMRKLSSTFTYCIFTASTIEIANTTSTDAIIALEAKRRLRKFMTWLSRMSGTWQSASHHLKILEQLGHGIDADLDGTGLPSQREVSASGSLTASRADSSPAGAITATAAMTKSAGTDVGPSALWMPKEAQSAGSLQGSGNDQQSAQPAQKNDGDRTSLIDAGRSTLPETLPAVVGDELSGLSVPGPIGAPMYLARPRAGYQMTSAPQDHREAQVNASGQNATLLYGWPTAPRMEQSNTSTNSAGTPVFDATGVPPTSDRITSPAGGANGAVNPTAYLKLHDTSYWGAMPLSSEDPLSWASFTNSYIEALNGMTQPLASSAVNIINNNSSNSNSNRDTQRK